MSDSFKSGIVIVGTLVAVFGIAGKGVWDSVVNVDANMRSMGKKPSFIRCRACGADAYLTTMPDDSIQFYRCESCESVTR